MRASATVSGRSTGWKGRRIHGATSTKSAVRPVRTSRVSQKMLDATRHARLRSPRSSSSRRGRFDAMPNIRQQEKRVGIAARQRLQNLRYRSTVKTLTKRLRAAVEEGDQEKVAAEHRELIRSIDKAASRGALHRNTAARRKAQAARLLSGGSRK